jgi:hypothetical protein
MFQFVFDTRLLTFTAPPQSKELLQLPSTIAAGDGKPHRRTHNPCIFRIVYGTRGLTAPDPPFLTARLLYQKPSQL